jgi:diguanylate cyclase (GGDEF)-like protein
VIKSVARTAEAQLRQSDWLGRYGGEEFVVALPGSNLAQAMAIAERIRAAIEANTLPCLNNRAGTVSIGVAVQECSGSDTSGVLDRADRALLKAKHLGRNRVEAGEPETTADRVAA